MRTGATSSTTLTLPFRCSFLSSIKGRSAAKRKRRSISRHRRTLSILSAQNTGDMLKNQLAKGNNGLVKAKYITFAIEADSLGAAKIPPSRIETDVLNNFKLLGVSARPMTGYERLKMLHGIFHPEGGQFAFDFSWLAPSGLSTKDFIAPSSFRLARGVISAWGAKSARFHSLKSLRRN